MQVTVEAGEGLARHMIVELPADDFERQVDQKLRDVARQARIPGFRPGKVPMRVLRQRFGESVRGEVFGEMVQSSFVRAVTDQDLRPAGMPEIEPDIDAGSRRYAYVAKFDVMPEVELKDLTGKRITRPVTAVTDADVEAMVERLREQRRTFEDVERPAQSGDRVTITFAGSIDGEPFEGGSGEHHQLVLGSERFIPGFEAQLEGASAGEERVVDVTFPEAYQNADLAGRAAQFQVSVEAVAAPSLPAVDADFMAAFDIDDGDAERFRADVRANMERELAQRIEANVKKQVMDALLEANPVNLPATLVSAEIQDMKRQTLQAAGAGANGIDLPDELFAESAERRAKLTLVMREVVKRYELQPSPEQVEALVEEWAATYENPAEVVGYYHSDPQRLSEVESVVLEKLAIERLLESADVEDEPSSFDDLVKATDA